MKSNFAIMMKSNFMCCFLGLLLDWNWNEFCVFQKKFSVAFLGSSDTKHLKRHSNSKVQKQEVYKETETGRCRLKHSMISSKESWSSQII